MFYLIRQRNGNETIGNIRLSLSIVKASTNDVDIKFRKIITQIFKENWKKLKILKIKNIKNWEKNSEIEPSIDFFVPLLIEFNFYRFSIKINPID